ncbi:MAG: hypothetical protein R8G66_20235 [Cytophagales bacterium]|nr:hypothetical protein [Cytophagales bacterium]
MIRLKAGVLAYTMAVSLVVSIILSSLILLGYYTRLESLQYDINLKVDSNLQSAEQLALSNPESFDYFQQKRLDLFGEGEDTVMLERRPWGVFDYFKITARHGRFERTSYFSIAHVPSEKARSALFLVDERRPLSVVGSTRLTGTVYLPQSGIQSAYVERVGYQNDSLFYGTRLTSDGDMPELNDKVMDAIEEVRKYPHRVSYREPFNLEQKFSSDTLIRFRSSRMNVNDTLNGFIWIDARKVVLDSLCRLDNVLVTADVIEFKNGFEGSGQFFAEDTIYVRSGAKVDYPSVLFVSSGLSNGSIQIESKAEVQGIVGVDGDVNNYYQRHIHLHQGGKISGAIYSHGFLETYGDIEGHATVRKSLVNATSAIYENYFLNAKIDGTKQNEHFLVPPLWFYEDDRKVLRWLK